MFSVLIQNQKTTESFEQYRSLFMSALDNEEVDVCRWVESGRDLESAVLGLTDIINDKEEWRAIIVNWVSDFDAPAECYATDELNPYDFTVNKNKEARDDYTESVVPLIRLTNILGGVPTCSKKGSDAWSGLDEESQNAYGRYLDRVSEYETLKDKYDVNFRKPSEILVINVRNGNRVNEIKAQRKASSLYEYDSSNFWERNLYPDMCRFFVFDLFKNGPVKLDEDEFRFWNTVRILSTNVVDPSAVAAYKLYKINVKINRSELAKCIQDKADRMDGIDSLVEDAIKNERDKIIKDIKGIPDYTVTKDIMQGLKGYRFGSATDRGYKLISKDTNQEVRRWNDMESVAKSDIIGYAKRVSHSLEDIAEEIRDVDAYSENEVHNMSNFDEENMRADLEERYLKILRLQRDIPYKKAPLCDELIDQGNKVSSKLGNRLCSNTLQRVLTALAISLIFFAVPLLYYIFAKKVDYDFSFWAILVLMLLLFGIVIIVTMIVFRVQLRSMVNQYNYIHRAEISRACSDNGVLNDFISNIATYAKGNSYLEVLGKKKSKVDDRYYKYNRHVIAAELYRASLRKWSIAYGLDVLFNNGFYIKADYNMEVAPNHNMVFSLENYKKEIEINKSGNYYESPFSYISRFEMIREDLYRYDEHN